MAKLVHLPEAIARRQRRLNGLAQADELAMLPVANKWWRLTTHRLVFWTVIVALFAAATLGYQYFLIMGIAHERNLANAGISASLGLLFALVPLGAWRVVVERFRLVRGDQIAVVSAWSLGLAGLLFAAVMCLRQVKVRSLPHAWTATGVGTVGAVGAAVLLAGLGVSTWLAVRAQRRGNGRRWSLAALAFGVLTLAAAGGWLWWANTRMVPLQPIDVPPEAAVMMNPARYVEALSKAMEKAWPTAACYIAGFLLLVDRRRPVGWLGWFAAFAWGAGAATMLSVEINTWAGQLLGSGEAEAGAANTRTAVYIAPFVEETAKASILFFLVALWRTRLVNRLNMLTLAGLSAIGFAYTENIIYYMRATLFANSEISAGDPDAALNQLALLRGVVTSWGHPLFTTMTGMGLAIGMRNRSKLARILFPLAGWLVAAGLHMTFNLMASANQDQGKLVRSFLYMGAGIVISLLIFLVTTNLREARLVRARLTDYARMGWLRERDPKVFSSSWIRLRLIPLALLVGVRCWWHTIRLNRAMTELAYLRDAMTRGLVDAGGQARERDLLGMIRAARPYALSDVRGYRGFPYFWYRLPYVGRLFSNPVLAVAQPSATPVITGPRQYSAVDPTWAPPA